MPVQIFKLPSRFAMVIVLFVLWMAPCCDAETGQPPRAAEIKWEKDYGQSMELAKKSERWLCVYFYDDASDHDFWNRWVELEQEEFSKLASQFVFCRVPTDQQESVNGEPLRLLEHEAFREMQNSTGIAIIDCVNEERVTFGEVVSVFPRSSTRALSPSVLQKLFRLPQGTLTQRSLTLAVSLHPDQPKSIQGTWHTALATAAESHSVNQANLRRQGHHQWNQRFQELMQQLGGGLNPQEVCAESWPHQNLMDAAEECVSSWRHSSGHWQAVSSEQAAFAYDMKRGSNGIWYATGIFAHK
jgi:hypothetical protein